MKHLTNKYGAVEIFVPYDLRNNLIYYMTLFSHSDIFIPIEVAILKNTLYGESDRDLFFMSLMSGTIKSRVIA